MNKLENVFKTICAVAIILLFGNIYQGCNNSRLKTQVTSLKGNISIKDSTIKNLALINQGQCIKLDADSARIAQDKTDGLQIQTITAEYVQKVETVLNDLKK